MEWLNLDKVSDNISILTLGTGLGTPISCLVMRVIIRSMLHVITPNTGRP